MNRSPGSNPVAPRVDLIYCIRMKQLITVSVIVVVCVCGCGTPRAAGEPAPAVGTLEDGGGEEEAEVVVEDDAPN